MKNDCSVVKDLIPLYTEGLVSEETKEFICEHCKRCKKCKELFDNTAVPAVDDHDDNGKKEKIWNEIARKERKRKRREYTFALLAAVILISAAVYLFCSQFKSYEQPTQYDFTVTDRTLNCTNYTENDVYDAARAVKAYFEKKYEGNLLRLAYDERSTTDKDRYETSGHPDAIVFKCDYYLNQRPIAGDDHQLRTEWSWLVEKDSSGEWIVVDGGYG